MELEQPKVPRFRFTNPRQERIYRRLLLVGPGPADFYRDACQLLASPRGLATTAHLVAHLLREIESALRDVLETVADMSSVQQASKQGQGHKAEIIAILRALDIAETDPMAQAWLRLAEKDYGLASRAHRDRLDPPRQMDAEFQVVWSEMEAILDAVLDRFEARYGKVVEVLDDLLKRKTPSPADIDKLTQNIPNNLVARGHLFDHLQSAEWLGPLRKAGFFRRPAQPEVNPENGSAQLPGWPESRYLARVAKEHPVEVLEIILEAEPTQNARVHADFLDGAKEMPADFAVRLVAAVTGWLESDYGAFLLIDRIQGLIIQLAEGGQGEGALNLARALLALSAGRHDPASLFPSEPVPRFERWFYKDVLDKISPVLTRTSGSRWLEAMSELLADAVRFTLPEGEREGPEDRSEWWRQAIEDHGQNEPQDPVTDRLVVAVRDAALELVGRDASTISNVVAMLEARPFKIFRRIALHVLRSFPDAGWALIVERLTNGAYFDDSAFHHEYFHLARECFAKLDPTSQAVILGWIDEGPDVGQVNARLQERLGREPTAEELNDWLDSWRFHKLTPLHDALTGAWRERYDQLAKRFPAEDHPDFLIYSSGAVYTGFPSPKNVEELRGMPLPDLVTFLKTWEPGGGPLEASPEGLAQKLTALAKSDPEGFGADAPQFKGLDPTYVRAVLDGLQQTVREGKAIPWQPVLDLCAWVVTQPRDHVEREKSVREADPDWGWARRTAARLLDDGLASGPAEIPIRLRSQVWDVLRPLTEDPEPTPEYVAKYGGSNMDPSTLSINTVRGEAMHAAMRYGLWVRKALEKVPEGAERLKRGFDDIPELKAVLEGHLDVAIDPSPAIRAVYGQWFPFLALLDEQWARQNVSKIFPMDDASRPLWNAAWGTYVTYSQPYDNTFPLLAEQYRYAVDLLGSGSKERVALRENPESHVAEHLMQLYWRGKILLDGADNLLGRFYLKASVELRAYALEHVGRALSNTNGAVDVAILDRMKRLWEWRLAVARDSGNVAPFGPELAAFGWWFRSGKFDDAWAIEQLKNSLEVTHQTYRETYVVMERLAEIAPRMSLKAIECAALIIAGDAEGWVARLHREELRRILQTGLASDEPGARQAAADLVNRLVAHGELDFRDLLN